MINLAKLQQGRYDQRAIVCSEESLLAYHSSEELSWEFPPLLLSHLLFPESIAGDLLLNAPKFQYRLFELKVPSHATGFTPALLNVVACLDIFHQKTGIFLIMLFH